MLTFLKIENVATVRECTLLPGPGLNVLTGETGAGKSIVVLALGLVLGGRASRDVVRTGCRAAVVTASFDLAENGAAQAALLDCGLADDEPLLVVRREVAEDGRHRVLVNGRPATLAMLAGVTSHLGEVHGQHENQQLLQPWTHLGLIDAAAGLTADLAALAGLHARLAAAVDAAARLAADERQRAQRLDALTFQVAEIEAARLPEPPPGPPDEDARLAAEHARLARAEDIAQAVEEAAALAYESDDSAVSLLARAERALAPVAGLSSELNEVRRGLAAAIESVGESGRRLLGLRAVAETSPEALANLERRIDELDRLKTKYGPSLAEVRAHLAGARAERAALVDADSRRSALAAEVTKEAAAYSAAAGQLSGRRAAAAPRLKSALAAALAELGMPGARVAIDLHQVEEAGSPVLVGDRALTFGPSGVDAVRLSFSANPGEEPRPLQRVASGGELSRLMLVLRGLAGPAAARQRRTWVFDEVDAGVGGTAALAVGERLAALAARGHQVLCVTHLAQVARQATCHHRVSKRTRGGRAETAVVRLDEATRVVELARMLGGRDTAAARRHAAELLAGAGAGVAAAVPAGLAAAAPERLP